MKGTQAHPARHGAQEGRQTGETTEFSADEDALAKLSVEGHNLGSMIERVTHERLQTLSQLVESGQFTIPVEQTLPFDHVEQALEESQSGTVQGKLVLLGSPDAV